MFGFSIGYVEQLKYDWLVKHYLLYTSVISESVTLQYCFALASIFNNLATIYIVQKHVDKCSEYQIAVEKSLEKNVKICTCGIQTWTLSLEGTELNQQIIWTVV